MVEITEKNWKDYVGQPVVMYDAKELPLFRIYKEFYGGRHLPTSGSSWKHARTLTEEELQPFLKGQQAFKIYKGACSLGAVSNEGLAERLCKADDEVFYVKDCRYAPYGLEEDYVETQFFKDKRRHVFEDGWALEHEVTYGYHPTHSVSYYKDNKKVAECIFRTENCVESEMRHLRELQDPKSAKKEELTRKLEEIETKAQEIRAELGEL